MAARGKAASGGGGDVAAKLMQTNPIMEAVGNAKTIRNNNSSRFGKHFDVQFDEIGQVVGAFTSVYLLEKPRICLHMAGRPPCGDDGRAGARRARAPAQPV